MVVGFLFVITTSGVINTDNAVFKTREECVKETVEHMIAMSKEPEVFGYSGFCMDGKDFIILNPQGPRA